LNMKTIKAYGDDNPDLVPKQAQNMAGLNLCYIK
jgi:hypothetical protein